MTLRFSLWLQESGCGRSLTAAVGGTQRSSMLPSGYAAAAKHYFGNAEECWPQPTLSSSTLISCPPACLDPAGRHSASCLLIFHHPAHFYLSNSCTHELWARALLCAGQSEWEVSLPERSWISCKDPISSCASTPSLFYPVFTEVPLWLV